MITLRSRDMPGHWRVALVEDVDRNRYIEIQCDDKFVYNLSPSHKLYKLFYTMLEASPVIDDQELLKLYESSTNGISHKYGRVLAYARAVIEITRKGWGL